MNENDIIEITENCLDKWQSCLVKKVDIEAKFNYLNPFFFFIAGITVAVFLIQIKNWLLDPSPAKDIDFSNFTYKYSNSRIWWHMYWIFTAIFLHWWFEHIIWNLLFFYLFTLISHRIIGFYESVLVYVITWLSAGLLSYFLNDVPSMWASGAIFWLLGFFTIFFFMFKNKIADNVQDLSWVFLIMAIMEILSWLSVPYIDNYAHIWWYLSWMLLWYLYFKFVYDENSIA
jgi:membrane associated rhomboid family serine protease